MSINCIDFFEHFFEHFDKYFLWWNRSSFTNEYWSRDMIESIGESGINTLKW